MPERRDEPDYDWLYGTQRKGIGEGRPPGADDATQVQPRSGSAPRDPEPTRMLPTVDRPSRSRASASGPYETPPPARPRSGGASGGGSGSWSESGGGGGR